MKRLFVLILFTSFLFAKTCIIAYSAYKIPEFQKERFLALFPDYAIIEKQKKYEVLKLGPFRRIKDSRSFLKSVKKYYKNAFIVNCTNPFRKPKIKTSQPHINKQPSIKISKNFQTIITQPNINQKLTPCRLNCKNKKCQPSKEKKYAWELNINKIKKQIKLTLSPIVAFPKNIKQESNETNKTCLASLLRFYINGGISYIIGQKPVNSNRLLGNNENIKLGLQYSCFTKNWKFYTDDRIIFSRKEKNSIITKGIDLDIKELYLKSYGLFDNRLNFLIGRKQLFDNRSWWIDKSMDTLGIFNLHDLWLYEIYIGGRFNNPSLLSNSTSSTSNLKHTKFALGHLTFQWHYLEYLGFFALKEKTNVVSNKRDINWLGIRAFGDKYLNADSKIRYWIDIAKNKGSYNYKNINGLAYDIGAIYMKNQYSLGGSYAYGSKEYFQPIFTDNKSKFIQKDIKFRYYGEFLDPKLTNISIFSLYGAYKPSIEKTYILALHNYHQINSSYPIQTTSYIVQPNGSDKYIGNEVDLLYQYLLSLRYNYKIILSYFKGANAFNKVADKKDGLYAKFDFNYYW